MRVTYSRGLLYGWLTSKKAIFLILGAVIALGTVGVAIVQVISWFS